MRFWDLMAGNPPFPTVRKLPFLCVLCFFFKNIWMTLFELDSVADQQISLIPTLVISTLDTGSLGLFKAMLDCQQSGRMCWWDDLSAAFLLLPDGWWKTREGVFHGKPMTSEQMNSTGARRITTEEDLAFHTGLPSLRESLKNLFQFEVVGWWGSSAAPQELELELGAEHIQDQLMRPESCQSRPAVAEVHGEIEGPRTDQVEVLIEQIQPVIRAWNDMQVRCWVLQSEDLERIAGECLFRDSAWR